MKKAQIIKSLLPIFILFLTVGCERNENEIFVTSETQKLIKSRSVNDSLKTVNLNVYTKSYFDYKYNVGDHIDVCYVSIDDPENMDLWVPLKNDDYATHILRMTPGRHQIWLEVEIDDGSSYTYPCETCEIVAISKEGDRSTTLFNNCVRKKHPNSSITNATFLANFYINIPNTVDDEYNLDINLTLYDQTNDDGSIAPPYTNGNIRIYAYHQWETNFQVIQPTDYQFILGVEYDNPDKTEFIYSHIQGTQDIYTDMNGITMNNLCGYYENVKLPNADGIGYKMYLITNTSVEYEPGLQINEEGVSWYSAFYREKNYDGTYTEWYPVDELKTTAIPSIWIDATIDFYTNLEIVCFNTKEMQDTYASEWGIEFYE